MIYKTYAIYSVDDPRELNFDITDEKKYIKKLVDRLSKLDLKRPDKKYSEIYYQRYVKKYDITLICRIHNITPEELTFRLLDIVNVVNAQAA